MAVQRLTAAYRSRPRPSSTLGAKASTMCPYYLDGELRSGHEVRNGANLPLRAARRERLEFLYLAFVQFSSSAEAAGKVFPSRSLETEQRSDARRRLEKVRSTFRDIRGVLPWMDSLVPVVG
jgi:hypothetical protein